MITLEEQLKEQIKNNGYSMYSLSKKSGINQTTLQRALNGERPISRENFDRIISYLRLTPVEQKKLENAYTISKIGEPGYKKITFIKNLLEMKPKNTAPMDPMLHFSPLKITKSTVITGKGNIMNTICCLLATDSTIENNILYAFSNFQDDFFRLLYEQLQQASINNLEIKHIIPFIKETKDSPDNTILSNLKTISQVIPCVLSGNHKSIQFYYYYTNTELSMLSGVPYPFYIMTQHNIVFISKDYESALVLPEENIHPFKDTFTQLLNISLPLVSPRITPAQIDSKTPNVLSPYQIRPYCNAIHYDKNLKTAPIKMAFPKSKFDIFISDISNKNFSPNEKIKICKRILAFNQHNIQKYIILQDAIFNINLGVVMNDDESITFYTTDSTDSNIQMCTLYEPTITRSFDCFFANMITLNYAYSPEDTNKLIISAIHKLQ